MNFILAVSLSLVGLASSHPVAPSDDPIRILPKNWKFEITSLKGPGCPDFGIPDGRDRHTRLTYGANTVDGSENYLWYVAYPYLRVDLGKTDSIWCETELQYTENNLYPELVETADYRLRLHKNGSRVITTYDLDNDVEATFTLSYLDADVTDSYTLRGPAASVHGSQFELVSPQSYPPHPERECGAAKLKFRTELKVSGTGTKGVVDSEKHEDGDTLQYYGTQMGFSYDWQRCAK
ncbi:hypothetical protein GGR51DRAFT_542118 [Nemania sp. FL0031]|nr:hypothetical protein GGR51DRAFT_542118 [Nemania sp. FL0031]